MSGATFGSKSLAEVIQMALDRRMRATGVALPGTVVSYDAAARTCSVRPGVHRLVPSIEDSDVDEFEELPTIQDVPVCWPRGRGFELRGASLQAGDPVLIVCLDRDASGWRNTGQAAEPADARMHSWASAVAIPGLLPDTSPFPPESDAAALASRVDAFGRAVAALTPPTTPVEAQATCGAIIAAFKAVFPVPLSTSGSTVLKLGG